MALRTTARRSALDHFVCKRRSCARPSANNRPSIASCAWSTPCTLRRLCETMAETVASVFLTRWCSSSSINFCSLSDVSRSLASMPALASRSLVLISAWARRSRRLTFSAARASSYDSVPPGCWPVRRSISSIGYCITWTFRHERGRPRHRHFAWAPSLRRNTQGFQQHFQGSRPCALPQCACLPTASHELCRGRRPPGSLARKPTTAELNLVSCLPDPAAKARRSRLPLDEH